MLKLTFLYLKSFVELWVYFDFETKKLCSQKKRRDTWGQADDGAIKGTKDTAILMRCAMVENKVIKKGNVGGK